MMKELTRFIERKTLLYKTGVEYGDYTINHVQGCAHGCLYPCYAFMMAKRFGKVSSYEDWVEPALVSNTMELLDKEIPRLRNKINSVHLCFSTDPFMYQYKAIADMSIRIIKRLNENDIKVTVLTKGVLPLELTRLSPVNEYGITLVSLDENFRERIEPNAAPYEKRIEALRQLHDRGCKTWVSIEPYPTPNIIDQDLNEILTAVSFVDKIIFGRTNYNARVTQYRDYRDFYNLQSQNVIDFCNENEIDFHIKNGTVHYEEAEQVNEVNGCYRINEQ